MNCRAQVALDYLVAYGWIFVAVATFFGLLTFIYAPPIANVSCASSDPVRIAVKGVNISTPTSPLNEITLQNLNSGAISITGVAVDGAGYFETGNAMALNGAPASGISPANALAVGGSAEISIKNFFINKEKGKNGRMTISYTDSGGQSLEANISCNGWPLS
ncbi:MAG: hypothetical protein NTW59_03705 [Candidatus Diapherotrites archaeon]|nr:hypothetical protein [Candidatus Diapherotrites archaeon]